MTDPELIAMRTKLHGLGIPSDSLPDSTIRACGLFHLQTFGPGDPSRLDGLSGFKGQLGSNYFIVDGQTQAEVESATWTCLLSRIHPELFPEK